MLEAAARVLRLARLATGLFFVRVGARVAGQAWEAPAAAAPARPSAPLATIGPAAQAMIDAGRQPRRRRVEEPREVLVGSAEHRRQLADAARRAGGG